MDPNSQNQQWSQWTFRVRHKTPPPPMAMVRENVLRFARRGFGSAGRVHFAPPSASGDVTRPTYLWTIIVQVEGANANDPTKRRYMFEAWTRFFREGFGMATGVDLDVKLLAGAPEDGRPADQWIIMPEKPLTLASVLYGVEAEQPGRVRPPDQGVGTAFIRTTPRKRPM